MTLEIPDPCLLVLCGPAGSGKSSWARDRFASTEVVSSDSIRGMICDDPADQSVHGPTFDLLHRLVRERLKLRRLTVVDATHLDKRGREPLLRMARKAGLPACLVFFDVDEATCTRRDAGRSRSVGAAVVARHCRSAREARTAVQHEHWDAVHVLGPEALESSELIRSPLPPDRRSERGPFDIVGDVHGCFAELEQLLEKLGYDSEGRHGQDRRLVFVGDLVDRGPSSLSVLRRVLDLVAAGRALFVPGNHDSKFSRWLRGRDVKISGGLETTVAEWELLAPSERESLRERFCTLMDASAPYLWLDGGELVVAHAGLEERDLGRVGRRIEAFCYYGKVTGKQQDGYPQRLDWAADYSGTAAVVYGHVPVRSAEWRNNTADVDLGCVYGGQLCAVRWPERDFVQVPAERQHWPRDSPARELPRLEDLPRS